MNRIVNVTFPAFTISGDDIDDIIDEAVKQIISFRKEAKGEFLKYQTLMSTVINTVPESISKSN